jgi:hypothetical protein
MGDQLPTPSTLADSLAALPSIYTSNQSGLNGDLAFVKNPLKSKRDQDSFMQEDEDSYFTMSDEPPVKKPRPFQFSS